MARNRKHGSEASIRQRSNGMYEAVWYDAEDRLQRRSTGTADAVQAKAILHRIVADVLKPKLGVDPTLAQVIDAYLENRKKMKPTTWRQIEVSLTPVRGRLGDLRTSELSQDHIDDYASWRLSQKPHKRTAATYSPSTVAKDLRMLRAALNDSHTRLHIKTPPAFKIEVTENAPRDEYLTQAEVTRMLDRCHVEQKVEVVGDKATVTYRERDRRHLEGFILLAVTTAARKEAILDLRWKQVHLQGPEDVEGALLDWGTGNVTGKHWIDFGQGRGNKKRPRIPISQNPELIRWLWFGAERNDPDGASKHGPDDHVITYQGEPVLDLKKGLKTLADEAGITKKIAPAHTLKHTAITWMVQGGVPLRTISDLTNTSEIILRKVYGHHIPDYHTELSMVSFG